MDQSRATDPHPDWPELVVLNEANFQAWLKSPSGLSATGFGKIGPVEGQNEALMDLQRLKQARK